MGGKAPLDFEISHFPTKFVAKKGCFLVSSGKNDISLFFPLPGKILLVTMEIHYRPPGKNLSDANGNKVKVGITVAQAIKKLF